MSQRCLSPGKRRGCCCLLRELPKLPEQGDVGWLCPSKSSESVLLRKAQGLGKRCCGKGLLKVPAEGWGQAGELRGAVRVREPAWRGAAWLWAAWCC